MSSLTSGGATDAEIENIHIVWRRGSPTSIVVGLQQPTCFIHLFLFLLVLNHLVAFHGPFLSDFATKYFYTLPFMLYLLTIPGSNLNYFVLPVGRCLLSPQLPGK